MPSAFLPLLLLAISLSACQSSSTTNNQSESSGPPASLTATVPEKEAGHDRAVAVSNDFLIVPGERVGPIKSTTSEAELVKLLGPSVVTASDTIYGAEGEEFMGTTLYKNTSDEVQIIYADEKRTKPETIRIRPQLVDDEGLPIPTVAPTRWTTADGLRIGTTLKELEKRNGKPFKLWGFEWDYGGMVSSWQGGKLTPPNKKSFVSIGLGAPVSRTPAQEKAYNKLMGDGEFMSSTPALQVLNPVVVSIGVGFAQ
ncbi:hypothetical protein GCM10028819_30420 [Spirosoma humi]